MSLGSSSERMQMFLHCRLAVAAAALGLAAPLALAAGSTGAATALLLAGLLPAVVALDDRNSRMPFRACVFTLLITGATLAGGILRGLPAALSLLLLALLVVEALLAVGRRDRARIASVAVAAAAMPATASVVGGAAGAGAGLLAVAVVTILLINAIALAASLSAVATRRLTGIRRRLRALRRGAFLMSETVIAMDHTGKVIEVGRNARQALGLPPNALQGRGLTELTQVADRPLLLAACAEAFPADGHESRVRFRLRDNVGDGIPRFRWAELRFTGPSDQGVRLASLRDVSAIASDEARRAKAVAASQRAQEARHAFLSTVNHELRTPLNAVIGFSEFLANPMTTPADKAKVREYAGLIHEAGHELLRKVAAMIDITRMQSGAYEFAAEPADMDAVVRATIMRFVADRSLEADAISLAVPGQPTMVEVDQRAFSSALSELLANAYKHGLGEKVSVGLKPGRDRILVVVADCGPGARSDRLASLHQDLALADEELTRSKGGLGLGLTLARGVMALHGGSVTFANRIAGGAEVTLQLPVRQAAADDATLVDLSTRRKSSTLDAPANRKKKRA